MSWVKVLSGELEEGEREVVSVREREVLLINHEGTIYAMESRCPHMRLPLKAASVETTSEGVTLTCRWHHSAFDLQTGDVRDWSPWPPAVGKMLGALRRERALTIYPVRVVEEEIWVEIPDEGRTTKDE